VSQSKLSSKKPDLTPVLRLLMRSAGIASFKALREFGLSKKQIQKLRRGEINELRFETILQFSDVLKISLSELLTTFLPEESLCALPTSPIPQQEGMAEQMQILQQEYQRLQTQLKDQRELLWQEFQQQTLQILESFLLQWPTAAYAARRNPDAPAVKLLPLARPIEQLLQAWDILPIGEVGVDVCYDPQLHQSMAGTEIPTGAPVRIRYVGYRQGDCLLYRAKVSADV
jgi:DNA-binding Xre family transcriptional regulator